MTEGASQDKAAGPWLFWLILALGLGSLRWARLGEWGLWIDEAFTLHDIRGLADGSVPRPGNPVGYWLIGFGLAAFDSESEWALRILPAIAGWLVIPATFWAWRPFAGRSRAALAALLVAASTWQLYWSQNARFYTFAQLATVVAGGLFARALLAPRARAVAVELATLWAPALACAALAALSHPSAGLTLGAVIAAPLVLWAIGLRGEPARGRRTLVFGLLLGAGLVAALPWAGALWERYQSNKGDPSPVHLVMTVGYHVTPWLLLAATAGALAAWRSRGEMELWAGAIVVATLGVALALSLQARVSAQYVFVVLPWIALLGAHGIVEIATRREWSVGLLSLAFVLPGALDQAHYFLARNGDRERWREANQFVWNARGESDMVVAMAAPVAEYYLSPRSSTFKQPLAVVPLTKHNAQVTRQWARRERAAWYVVLDEWLADWPSDERAGFRSFLERQCTLEQTFAVAHPFRDLTVRVYRRR